MSVFALLFRAVSSFKPTEQLSDGTSSLRAFPPVGDLSLRNRTDAFERAPAGLLVLNAVPVTGLTVLLSLLVRSLAALSFAFLRWSGGELLPSVIPATPIVPVEIVAIPLPLIGSELPWLGMDGLTAGRLDTHRVQSIPWIADGLTVLLFVQDLRDLSGDLVEAARVEGASG